MRAVDISSYGIIKTYEIPAKTDILVALQSAVGGYIESAFTFRMADNFTITGYVNEEGLLIGLPIGLVIQHPSGYLAPVAGDLVIVGLDENTGDTIGLTDNACQNIHVSEPKVIRGDGWELYARLVTITGLHPAEFEPRGGLLDEADCMDLRDEELPFGYS